MTPSEKDTAPQAVGRGAVDPALAGTADLTPVIQYGDGTGYCKRCGMNEPRHISRCPEAKKESA